MSFKKVIYLGQTWSKVDGSKPTHSHAPVYTPVCAARYKYINSIHNSTPVRCKLMLHYQSYLYTGMVQPQDLWGSINVGGAG